jgi:hypothetical protein
LKDEVRREDASFLIPEYGSQALSLLESWKDFEGLVSNVSYPELPVEFGGIHCLEAEPLFFDID